MSDEYRIYFINGEVKISRTTAEEAVNEIFTSRLLSRQDFPDIESAVRFLEYNLDYAPDLDPLLYAGIVQCILKLVEPTQFQYALDWE